MKKLSELCLSCIAENFERFMFDYTSGNCIPKSYFEFLQRAYSVPLLEKLLHTDEFENYIDFLLNPYIREVNLKVAIDDATLIIDRLIDIGPTITSLRLPNSDYKNSSLVELVSFLSNAESLILDGENISPNIYMGIGNNCHNLKTLELLCEDVTDECIEALYIPENDICERNLSKVLQHLSFDHVNKVTTKSLKYVLENFQGLQFLRHYDLFEAVYELHAGDLKNNDLDSVRKYNLQELKIFDAERYPVEFIELCAEFFPHVKILSLYNINSQAQVDALKTFPVLEELCLVFWCGSCDLSSLLELKGNDLNKLNIWDGTISLNSLLFCTNLKSLEIADYDDLTIKDDMSMSDGLLKHCKELTLKFDFQENINMHLAECILSLCPNVEKLSFRNSRGVSADFIQIIITQECIKTLKELLNFDLTDVEFLSVKYIIENTLNLEIVSLCYCDNCTTREIEHLKLLKPFMTIDS